MKYHISHTTTYDYTDPVSLCHNFLHLRPRICPTQLFQRHDLLVLPEPHAVLEHDDYFGNPTSCFSIQEPHRRLSIASQAWVDVAKPAALPESPPWEVVQERMKEEVGRMKKTDLAPHPSSFILHPSSDLHPSNDIQYLFDSHYIHCSDALRDYAAGSFRDKPGEPFLSAVFDLTKRIHADFRYDKRATNLSTTIAEVLAQKRGVCQDFAHLQIGCLRSLGFPARYVSGYLLTMPKPGQERLIGADASHAWVAAYCPGVGWFDFDPTNDQMAGERHITLAWGRDYDDVSPIRGVILGGGSHTMSVSVTVSAVEG